MTPCDACRRKTEVSSRAWPHVHQPDVRQVEDVSDQVQLQALTGNAAGSFIFSIPLQALGLKPAAGEKIQADIGILRGDGLQTVQRVYWSNKATGITADVPSEAELTPNLWGEWIFKATP